MSECESNQNLSQPLNSIAKVLSEDIEFSNKDTLPNELNFDKIIYSALADKIGSFDNKSVKIVVQYYMGIKSIEEQYKKLELFHGDSPADLISIRIKISTGHLKINDNYPGWNEIKEFLRNAEKVYNLGEELTKCLNKEISQQKNKRGEIMGIFNTGYTIIERINLENKKKSKLIEVLLIVGSILFAFKAQPDIIVSLFALNLFLSIIYYILIQNDTSKLNGASNILFNAIPVFIAGTFSLALNYNLFESLIKSGLDQFPRSTIVLYGIYYSTLSIIIWIALANLPNHQSQK